MSKIDPISQANFSAINGALIAIVHALKAKDSIDMEELHRGMAASIHFAKLKNNEQMLLMLESLDEGFRLDQLTSTHPIPLRLVPDPQPDDKGDP